MDLKIYKTPYLVWYSRTHNLYRITWKSVVYIDGEFYNIDGFDGKIVKVKIAGKICKYSIKKVRRFRYDALIRRNTLCNMLKPRDRYRYDIRSDNCYSCFISSFCSSVKGGYRKRHQLAIRDLLLLNKYREDNKDLAYDI